MTFAELKNIRQDNNKNCSHSKLSRVLCNIVSHNLARKIIFSLPVRNCTIFAQACVEDLIFLLKWLMLLFNFCVSTVSIVEHVINKTKPSFMQICVYLISFEEIFLAVLTCMWLIYNRISWYHKFAKIEYVTAKYSNSLRRPCPVKWILNERD